MGEHEVRSVALVVGGAVAGFVVAVVVAAGVMFRSLRDIWPGR